MIEAGPRELPEALMIEALERGQAEIKKLIALQREIIAETAPAKSPVKLFETDGPLSQGLKENFSARL